MKFLENFNTFNENQFGAASLNSNKHNSPYIKNYGESYPMNKLNIGDIITWLGTPYYIISNSDSIIKLSKTLNGPSLPNNKGVLDITEFTNKCCIQKDY
jgi:hypothetical protein